MYGTLRGALVGRKIAFDRESFVATVEGRIAGIGKTIHIKAIHVHYELAVPAEAREATAEELSACRQFLADAKTTPDRAREDLVVVLFNHNDFVTIR